MPFKYKRKSDRIFDREAFKKTCNDYRNGLSVREATVKFNIKKSNLYAYIKEANKKESTEFVDRNFTSRCSFIAEEEQGMTEYLKKKFSHPS